MLLPREQVLQGGLSPKPAPSLAHRCLLASEVAMTWPWREEEVMRVGVYRNEAWGLGSGCWKASQAKQAWLQRLKLTWWLLSGCCPAMESRLGSRRVWCVWAGSSCVLDCVQWEPSAVEEKEYWRTWSRQRKGLKPSVKSWIMVLGVLKWRRIFLEGFSHLGKKDWVAVWEANCRQVYSSAVDRYILMK